MKFRNSGKSTHGGNAFNGNASRRSRVGLDAAAAAIAEDEAADGAGKDIAKERSAPAGMMVVRKLSNELAVQTLNVERVLWAAVAARKSMNVDAAVKSIISWVNLNSKDRRAVFVTGISTDLLKELALRFPSGCAKLLNLVSRSQQPASCLEQLTQPL